MHTSFSLPAWEFETISCIYYTLCFMHRIPCETCSVGFGPWLCVCWMFLVSLCSPWKQAEPGLQCFSGLWIELRSFWSTQWVFGLGDGTADEHGLLFPLFGSLAVWKCKGIAGTCSVCGITSVLFEEEMRNRHVGSLEVSIEVCVWWEVIRDVKTYWY